jgi:hypothetical protein
MFEFAQSLVHRIVKVVLHLVTGKSELERITDKYPRERIKVVRGVRKSLRASRTLDDVKRKVVIAFNDFSVKSIVQNIRSVKKFENPGIVFAVGSLRRTNVAISHLSTLANTAFSDAYESALIELWDALQPGKPREGSNPRHSKSWADIGFQGMDPATDFRGGGMLSLENLRYFAREDGAVARQILTEQCGDITQGGFPFAITGINITAMLLSLATRRKLDDLFLFTSAEAEDTVRSIERDSARRSRAGVAAGDRLGQSDETTPLLSDSIRDAEDEHLDDDETRVLALERFNMAYSVVFTRFATRWREAAPRDAMGFPLVFGPFKKEIEELISTPAGIRYLINFDYVNVDRDQS